MKMRKLIFLAMTLLAVMATGCQDEELVQISDKSECESSHFVSLEKALAQVMPLYNGASENTRSLEELPEIESVAYHIVGGSSTRSSNEGIPFYIVNFKEKRGFAILSGDDRITSVYAFSDEGAINLKDTVNNIGLSYYINGIMPEIVAEEIEDYSKTNDDSANGVIPPGVIDPTPQPLPKYQFDVRPLLDPEQRIWNQRYPYNMYCKTATGERAKVGCGAVATALIMSYFKWPVNLEGKTFDWDNLLPLKYPSQRNYYAGFMEILGRPQYLNMSYGVDGSGCEMDKIEYTFGLFGYKYDKQDKIGLVEAKKSLKSGSPLMVFGKHMTIRTMSHVFVVDGYCTEYLQDEPAYLHIVWGWGSFDEDNAGLGNGYYLAKNGGFQSNPSFWDEDDNKTSPSSTWLLYYSLTMMYNFSLDGSK
ncbi:MAG: hypothetical protein HDS82_05275 [Bacteroidales bacterium]|nr:hypothetical protein [Bacteroidales bacterium]